MHLTQSRIAVLGTNVQSRLVYLYLSKALGHGHFWGGVGGVTNWEGRYAGYSSGSVVPPPRSVTGWWSCVSWYSVRVRVVNRILFGEHVVLIYVRASGQLYFSNVQTLLSANTTLRYRSSRPSACSWMRKTKDPDLLCRCLSLTVPVDRPQTPPLLIPKYFTHGVNDRAPVMKAYDDILHAVCSDGDGPPKLGAP